MSKRLCQLYAAERRRELTSSPRCWQSSGSIEQLVASEAWKHKPSVIADSKGSIVAANQIDLAHGEQHE